MAEGKYNITLAGGLGFENAYTLAMPRARAAALGTRTVSDLASHAPSLTIAGDYEFFGRPEWHALRQTYGLAFGAQNPCRRSSCIPPSRPAMSM